MKNKTDTEIVVKEPKTLKTYNKGSYLEIEADDLTAIINMTIKSIKEHKGKPAVYPNTLEGMEKLTQKTLEFFQYVNDVNANPENEKKLIPDIETWATFLGVTRKTILEYEKRSSEWQDMIQTFKNAMAACKKQLAMNYKIPPMVYVFDATNNHGYLNSNEFHLSVDAPNERAKISARNNLELELKENGLVWNEETQEYEPQKEV